MKVSGSVREFLDMITALTNVLYSIIDSGFLIQGEKEKLVNLLRALSKCHSSSSCTNALVKVIQFAWKFIGFIPYDERDVFSPHLSKFINKEKDIIPRLIHGDNARNYIIETIKSFASSVLQELLNEST